MAATKVREYHPKLGLSGIEEVYAASYTRFLRSLLHPSRPSESAIASVFKGISVLATPYNSVDGPRAVLRVKTYSLCIHNYNPIVVGGKNKQTRVTVGRMNRTFESEQHILRICFSATPNWNFRGYYQCYSCRQRPRRFGTTRTSHRLGTWTHFNSS